MSQDKILVIDDSATIRRLADSYLSPAGYQVTLAPNAEDGLQLAEETQPGLILLDHQLPGTTGYEVCCKLLENPSLAQTPVVISSTLRKKAYVEYAELANVVDMLPKPYTAELLATTVANALDTGAMIVQSQAQGTAVPEVIEEVGDAALQGSFQHFGLRELLDFLNNGQKAGVLEVEGRKTRMWFHVRDGRIQGATAGGIEAAELEPRLPAALTALAPVLPLTLCGRGGSDMGGIVELLDRRVVDGRLLRKLLQFQAAQLLLRSFREPLKEFRFHAGRPAPPVVAKLPLEVSALALLVDAALSAADDELPEWHSQQPFSRKVARGQSLDRAGLSPQHIKLAGLLVKPLPLDEIAARSGCDVAEARRVLYGLQLAELLELSDSAAEQHFVALALDEDSTDKLTRALGAEPGWTVHDVRDTMTLKLLLRRTRPAALAFRTEDEAAARTVEAIRKHKNSPIAASKLIGLAARQPSAKQSLDMLLRLPLSDAALQRLVQELCPAAAAPPSPAPSLAPSCLESKGVVDDHVGTA